MSRESRKRRQERRKHEKRKPAGSGQRNGLVSLNKWAQQLPPILRFAEEVYCTPEAWTAITDTTPGGVGNWDCPHAAALDSGSIDDRAWDVVFMAAKYICDSDEMIGRRVPSVVFPMFLPRASHPEVGNVPVVVKCDGNRRAVIVSCG